MTIPTEISARHIHLCREHLDKLFGENYELTKSKDLTQKGQFAAQESITIKTEKNQIANVRIVGPLRSRTQLEISKTDARHLGVNPPVRKPGDLDGSAGCKLIGPKGEVDIKEGLIIAWRHIHLSPQDAAKYGLSPDKYVSVKIDNGERGATFHKVYVHLDPNFTPLFCLDTDEGNAAGIEVKSEGEIII
ncbi:propanediol utilization protein [bacterium (Candidatus Gribaldobacteria) CG08_land_8_20_14_0_20_39_15]|uniref:Phosphate propanoyltransferase n=1 Tax=bacterium (Candidatus Gribaldobacteria) CG08_land_8_20_14_0_20_39_15 TaxID=2014273 RepID=A0A2M6XUE1_9BACT|nr:MAG: propanediol utilization protein [bacterium (Candidatus Gribaldobacteria) CG08_land_8_20_14_0_20_39_15]